MGKNQPPIYGCKASYIKIWRKMTIHKVGRFEKNGRKKREIVRMITLLSV